MSILIPLHLFLNFYMLYISTRERVKKFSFQQKHEHFFDKNVKNCNKVVKVT